MPTMKLDSVVNPGNSDQMVVYRDDPPPPPTPPAPAQRDVGSGGAIYSFDQIQSAASASATLENVDNSDNWIATMDDTGPVDVTVNWEEALQVDEYYNETSGQYDYYITMPDGDIPIIRG